MSVKLLILGIKAKLPPISVDNSVDKRFFYVKTSGFKVVNIFCIKNNQLL